MGKVIASRSTKNIARYFFAFFILVLLSSSNAIKLVQSAFEEKIDAEMKKPYAEAYSKRLYPFGSPAAIALALGPWFCVPGFHQVCHYRRSNIKKLFRLLTQEITCLLHVLRIIYISLGVFQLNLVCHCSLIWSHASRPSPYFLSLYHSWIPNPPGPLDPGIRNPTFLPLPSYSRIAIFPTLP
ncbi:hypothetical protein SDC9_55871 [bioreactor metagenome]|uniref:Uncharacterized protein n=1 Tax=bioreactor metagenome TaxID=1076179 RepID=A0A644X083_9ZZZZ